MHFFFEELEEDAAQETLALVRERGAEGLPVQADVSQKDQVDRMMAAVRDHFGPSDLLVNNAAIGAVENHDEFGFGEQSGEFVNAPDVPLPVSRPVTVGCTQIMLRVVAVQHVDLIAITK